MSDPLLKARAAEISRSFEQTMGRFEKATRDVSTARAESPEWIDAANRMTRLAPVRRNLTRALRTGRHSYVTTLNGVPIAFTPNGWVTQQDANAHLAKQRKGGR